MAKCIVIRGVTELQLGGIMEAIVDNGGTFIKHDTNNLNLEASFPTDAQCAAFHVSAIIINPAYADADGDPLQALNINAGSV